MKIFFYQKIKKKYHNLHCNFKQETKNNISIVFIRLYEKVKE
jgi:hypothetical protein